jgi:hypothetical protein
LNKFAHSHFADREGNAIDAPLDPRAKVGTLQGVAGAELASSFAD